MPPIYKSLITRCTQNISRTTRETRWQGCALRLLVLGAGSATTEPERRKKVSESLDSAPFMSRLHIPVTQDYTTTRLLPRAVEDELLRLRAASFSCCWLAVPLVSSPGTKQVRSESACTVRHEGRRVNANESALLRLAAARVGDEEGAVVGKEDVLELLLRRLVNVLLVESHDALRDGLADSCRFAFPERGQGAWKKTSAPPLRHLNAKRNSPTAPAARCAAAGTRTGEKSSAARRLAAQRSTSLPPTCARGAKR